MIPTESLFQTALANDSSLELSGDYRRYVAFEGAHPRVLRVGDLEAMLASRGDFARKFDPTIDRRVLDELDRRVHGRTPELR
jgi:hypothetical protein